MKFQMFELISFVDQRSAVFRLFYSDISSGIFRSILVINYYSQSSDLELYEMMEHRMLPFKVEEVAYGLGNYYVM